MDKEDFINKYRKNLGCKNIGQVCWCEICTTLENIWRDMLNPLVDVYDHPNHSNPKQRYLYKIREAVTLLKDFSNYKGGGEHALGVAVQLEQFHNRALKALKEADNG